MESKSAIYRSEIFRHLDGLVVAPVANSLWKKGVIQRIIENGSVELKNLANDFSANEGYLNVALRLMCSQGWLNQIKSNNEDIQFVTNERTVKVLELFPIYKHIVDLMEVSAQFHPRKFEKTPYLFLKKLYQLYENRFDLAKAEDQLTQELEEQVLKHIEGCLMGPTIVKMAMSGMFHKYFMEASFSPAEFHEDEESFTEILDFFSKRGWFSQKSGHFQFTEKGMFFAKRASAYGVTVSYMPLFTHINELIFGNPEKIWSRNEGDETHVDREMNVWGSGGAHNTYFKVIDEIIIEIFNRPIEEQPKGILDMGCGNGAFLEHLFELIDRHTLRGKMLDEHPLFLVGADYNQAALKVTRANLIKANIWAKVIWGDISDPDRLALDLKENYDIKLNELLNVRTFLDHNRIWEVVEAVNPNRKSNSSGAFTFRGRRLKNEEVEENLLMHLKKWSPYVQKFGLLVIELHTIDPAHTAANLGKTAASAYDATHGFSDQYIVEIDVFHKIAKEAGLSFVPKFFRKFPDSELATVSINLLKA